MKKKQKVKCAWKYDDVDDYFATSCGKKYCFNHGHIKENHFKFCPLCGKKIKEEK